MTEVSAGALGVGAGAAAGAAGPFPALPGDASAFAAALNAAGGAAHAGVLPDGTAIPGLDLKNQKSAADGAQGLPAGLEALLLGVPAVQPPVANGLNLDGEGGALDIEGAGSASASAEAGARAGVANGANGATGAGAPPAGGFVPQLPTASAGEGVPQAPVDPVQAGKGLPVPSVQPSGQQAGAPGDLSGTAGSPDAALEDVAASAAKAGEQVEVVSAEDAGADETLVKTVSTDAQPSAVGAPGAKDAAVVAAETVSAKADVQPPAEGQRRRRWQSDLPEDAKSTLLKQSLAADAANAQQAESDADSIVGVADGSKKTAKTAGDLPVVPVSGKDKPSPASTKSANSAAQVAASPVSVPGSGQIEGGEVDPDAADPQTEAVGTETLQSRKPASISAVSDDGQASGNPSVEAAAKQVAKKAADADLADQAAADDAALDDPDAVDPGEPVAVSEKTAKGTSVADAADDKASAGSGNAASRAAERNALAAAANAGSSGQAADVDADADPDGQLTLALNMRTDGNTSQMTTGRADMQQNPTQAQAAHVATQVASGIVRHLQNGQTRFHMRLDPPELGRVDVDLKVAHDGRVHAHLIVDRPETLDLFMRDQRGLERALQNAGLNTNADNLSFSLNDNGSQQSGFSWGNGDQDYPGDTSGPAADDSPDLIDSQNIQVAVRSQQGGLDIRI